MVGLRPDAVAERLTTLETRIIDLNDQASGWRRRAEAAEAELTELRARLAAWEARAGDVSRVQNEAQVYAQRLKLEAEREAEDLKARWREELAEAERELIMTRSQIDALRRDFLTLLERAATAVAGKRQEPAGFDSSRP